MNDRTYLMVQPVLVVKAEYYPAVDEVRYVPSLSTVHHRHCVRLHKPDRGFRALWDRQRPELERLLDHLLSFLLQFVPRLGRDRPDLRREHHYLLAS